MAHSVIDAAEVEAQHGVFRPLSQPLGVSSFKINRLELPAGAEGPEHDHAAEAEEEVYAVVEGSGTLRVEGNEIALTPGMFVFCSPEVRRQIAAGENGLTFIGIGATAK
jgi:quercetin dioxygenase-like cupin family protein